MDFPIGGGLKQNRPQSKGKRPGQTLQEYLKRVGGEIKKKRQDMKSKNQSEQFDRIKQKRQNISFRNSITQQIHEQGRRQSRELQNNMRQLRSNQQSQTRLTEQQYRAKIQKKHQQALKYHQRISSLTSTFGLIRQNQQQSKISPSDNNRVQSQSLLTNRIAEGELRRTNTQDQQSGRPTIFGSLSGNNLIFKAGQSLSEALRDTSKDKQSQERVRNSFNNNNNTQLTNSNFFNNKAQTNSNLFSNANSQSSQSSNIFSKLGGDAPQKPIIFSNNTTANNNQSKLNIFGEKIPENPASTLFTGKGASSFLSGQNNVNQSSLVKQIKQDRQISEQQKSNKDVEKPTLNIIGKTSTIVELNKEAQKRDNQDNGEKQKSSTSGGLYFFGQKVTSAPKSDSKLFDNNSVALLQNESYKKTEDIAKAEAKQPAKNFNLFNNSSSNKNLDPTKTFNLFNNNNTTPAGNQQTKESSSKQIGGLFNKNTDAIDQSQKESSKQIGGLFNNSNSTPNTQSKQSVKEIPIKQGQVSGLFNKSKDTKFDGQVVKDSSSSIQSGGLFGNNTRKVQESEEKPRNLFDNLKTSHQNKSNNLFNNSNNCDNKPNNIFNTPIDVEVVQKSQNDRKEEAKEKTTGLFGTVPTPSQNTGLFSNSNTKQPKTELFQSKKQEIKTNPVGGLFSSSTKQEGNKQEQMTSKPNLFNSNTSTGGLFSGMSSTNMFSKKQNSPAKQTLPSQQNALEKVEPSNKLSSASNNSSNLFSKPQQTQQKQKSFDQPSNKINLFGQKTSQNKEVSLPASSGSNNIFSRNTPQSNNLFSNLGSQSTSNMFSKAQQSDTSQELNTKTNMFGTIKPKVDNVFSRSSQDSASSTNMFSQNGSLFGGSLNTGTGGASLFAKAPVEQENEGSQSGDDNVGVDTHQVDMNAAQKWQYDLPEVLFKEEARKFKKVETSQSPAVENVTISIEKYAQSEDTLMVVRLPQSNNIIFNGIFKKQFKSLVTIMQSNKCSLKMDNVLHMVEVKQQKKLSKSHLRIQFKDQKTAERFVNLVNKIYQ